LKRGQPAIIVAAIMRRRGGTGQAIAPQPFVVDAEQKLRLPALRRIKRSDHDRVAAGENYRFSVFPDRSR
jgi:hypothetical protein